jgi:multimeric flavodoxin WrbA
MIYIKTLIISGSPRKKGDSMTLINEMIYLNGEVKIIETYYDNISPCLDCRYCWENEGCSIDDEMQEIYKLLDEVDNIILASPLYFSELSGELLSFASRLQTFFVARCIRKEVDFELKEKNGVLILTGGGDGSPDDAIRRANIIFRHINVKPIGKVLSLNTNKKSANQDAQALNRVKELALNLNELNKAN